MDVFVDMKFFMVDYDELVGNEIEIMIFKFKVSFDNFFC